MQLAWGYCCTCMDPLVHERAGRIACGIKQVLFKRISCCSLGTYSARADFSGWAERSDGRFLSLRRIRTLRSHLCIIFRELNGILQMPGFPKGCGSLPSLTVVRFRWPGRRLHFSAFRVYFKRNLKTILLPLRNSR